MQASPDIEGILVVGDADDGVLGRGLTFDGIALKEAGRGLRRLPDALVQMAVDDGGVSARAA